jgi:hypothetical protein
LDGSGNAYIAGGSSHIIIKVAVDGTITRFAGNATVGSTNGDADTAKFNNPVALAINPMFTTLYILEKGNHKVRTVTLTGTVTVGNLVGGGAADGTQASGAPVAGGVGDAARFNNPTGIAISPDGATLYVADTGNHVIQKVVISTQTATVYAGIAGTATSVNGALDTNTLNAPTAIVVDAIGNLFVAEKTLIRKISVEQVLFALFMPLLTLYFPHHSPVSSLCFLTSLIPHSSLLNFLSYIIPYCHLP